jgi:hypothetical protein
MIKVEVAGTIREYASLIAEYGDFIAVGGITLSLQDAVSQAKTVLQNNPSFKAFRYWVTMDDSGLAYQVWITKSGHYRVRGAAPLPGVSNVKDIYRA